MKIKVKLYDGGRLPIISNNKDWFDLVIPKNVTLLGPSAMPFKSKVRDGDEDRARRVEFNLYHISFGIKMELPDGYEATINLKRSTFAKCGILMSPSQEVIDNSYSYCEDVWGINVVPLKNVVIPKGISIVQFKIQLSQKATIWQRIKWLFSNGKIEFEEVDEF